MLWMDISRNDEGEVNSVVVGCNDDGLRAAYHDIRDSQVWLNRHFAKHHRYPDSTTIHQIGCRLSPLSTGPRKSYYVPVGPHTYATPATDQVVGLLSEEGSLTTQQVADLIDGKYNSTFVTLKRANEKGLITKTKQGLTVLWSAA